MTIILKQELVIEDKHGMSVIPAGSKIKLVKEGSDIHGQLMPEETGIVDKFGDAIAGLLPDGLVLVKKEVKDGMEEIEGRQTDVDDFDVHNVRTVAGRVVAEVSMPKEMVPFQFVATDAVNEESQLSKFVFYADIPAFDDIEYMMAKLADIDMFGNHDRDISESKIHSYPSQKTTNDTLVIGIVWDLNLTALPSDRGEGSTLVHRGKYRTGGNYPDA